MDQRVSTLVIGLGEIGAPLLAVLRRAHSDAVGIDLDPAETPAQAAVMHLCLPTPFDKLQR